MAQQFSQVQQPMESDPKEYENKSNNSVTVQAKSTVNKKPRVLSPTTLSYHQTLQSRIVFNPPLEIQSETPQTPGNPHPWNQHSWTKSLGEYGSLFGNLTPAASQTEGNLSTWEQPPMQNLAESASPLMKETAILQPIGSSNKGKQPALASGEHSNMQTPISLNITSVTKFTANQHYQHLRKETKNLCNNKFKVATTPDTATLEYYQSIYTHCKQRFNILDGIEIVKKSLFGNYNILEVRSNLYNNLVHYSHLGTEDLNSETLATYFQELNFNIIKYCEEKYPVQSKYSFDFESETETSNKGKQRLKQYLRTTPNTPTLQKTTAKHLQTPEQGTSIKLLLSITPFPISLVQSQTPSLPLSRFSRPEDFHANIIDYLQENESNHSESLESKETESEPEKIPENEEEMTTAYIAKIPEFTGEDNDTSPQEWLDKVQKAGDTNGWIAARMLKAIPYFLQGTAGEWFENLEEPFESWQTFKDAFLQQFTNNNTSITLRNRFRNIKQETSESVITYLRRFNKLFRQIRQLETNDYYSNAQILDQFIAELKDKLIKKVCPHAPADLATAIR
ncbi:hypothetical protein G9A89_014478 [Geosiphon pyriformis]|nr:hypothetical protein G9A89_014478 [Geosiphon pyriformis]